MVNKTMKIFVTLALVALALVQLISLVLADPLYPETITISHISRKPDPGVTEANITANATYVSELAVSIDQITKNWQGYYGQVTGDIVLDDVQNQSLYAWTLVDPIGEVYATRNSSINWTGGNIRCATNINETQPPWNGTHWRMSHIEREEFEMNTNAEMTGGLQARDGVNETFNVTTHPQFNVSNNPFAANECNHSTYLFVNDARGAKSFNETLLWANSDAALIFMAYINPNVAGFNTTTYDFEMLVTEDGHLDDVTTTDYYFYVELE